MSADSANTKPCYLHGRIVALVESIIGEEILPIGFAALCAPGRRNLAFDFWSRKALEKKNSLKEEEVRELQRLADATGLQVPSTDDGSYWSGYYYQKH